MDCIKNLLLLFILTLTACSEVYAWDKSRSIGSPALDASSIFQVNTNTKGSMPCPKMTLTERDAIVAPVSGICIFDTTTSSFENFDGIVWKKMGGGLSKWETATVFKIDDVVHESNKIYKALTDHTSGTFATDLANNDWIEISDDLNRETSVTDTALVLWDGTGGDDVKDSSILVDGSSNITGINDLTIGGDIISNGFNGDILDLLQVATPANPSVGRDKLYFKSDDKLYKLTNGGVETEVGASVSFANDNRVLRSDTVGADNLQQSGIIVDDTDNMTGVNNISANGDIKALAPDAVNFKEAGEKYKGEENYFIRGQADYGLAADWTASNLNKDTTASNFITGEFSVWKWTDTSTISNQAVSAVIDIPKGMRQSEIGYQFRYKYDGDDDDLDVLIQCVDDSSFKVKDGEHKLEAYITANGSAFATGEFAPSGCAQIKFIIKVAIANSGKELFFDSIKVTPFNPTIKKLQIREDYRTDGLVGHGSVNNVIPYYANERINTLSSSGIIDNSSTNGFSFTATKKTLVTFTHVSDSSGASLKNIGISLNSTQLTTSIVSINAGNRLAIAVGDSGGFSITVTWSGILQEGDVIRPHLQDNYTHNNNAINSISISTISDADTLVRKTNPNAVDSMIRFHTGNGFGSSSNKIRRFTNYTTDNAVAFVSAVGQTITTDAFECIDSATLGLVCEILSKGLYNLNYTDSHSAGNGYDFGFSVNSTQLTTALLSINAADRLTISEVPTLQTASVSSWSGILNKGDIIRPHTDGNPNGTTRVNFTISKAKVSPHVSIPIDDEYQNHFSAIISNNGTASIFSDDNSGFIQSVNRTSAGVVDVVFKVGLFTQIPKVIAIVSEGGTVFTSQVTNLTTAGFTFNSNDTASPYSGSDKQFSVDVSSQLSDVKKKTGIVTGKFAATRTCIIEDRKSSAIDGGGSVTAGVQTRTLNTASGDCEFLSITLGTTGIDGTGNRFSLNKGKYIISCLAPAFDVNNTQAYLYNTSDAVNSIIGKSEYTDSTDQVQVDAKLKGNITLSITKEFELRQHTLTLRATNGLGISSADESGNPLTYNVYSQCDIRKVQ